MDKYIAKFCVNSGLKHVNNFSSNHLLRFLYSLQLAVINFQACCLHVNVNKNYLDSLYNFFFLTCILWNLGSIYVGRGWW